MAGNLGPETCSIGHGFSLRGSSLHPYLQSSGRQAVKVLEKRAPKRTTMPRGNKWSVGQASTLASRVRVPSCRRRPSLDSGAFFAGVPATVAVAMPDAAIREGLSTFLGSTARLAHIAPSWRASFPRMFAVYSESPSDNLCRRFSAAPAGWQKVAVTVKKPAPRIQVAGRWNNRCFQLFTEREGSNVFGGAD